jgi:hydrogenase maturation protease
LSRILVLSIGSDLRGDDGVGKAITARLRLSSSLPTGVEIMDAGTGDLSTILMRPDINKVIIVDAANMGLVPGEWRRILANESICEISDENELDNSHGLGLLQAISLSRILGTLPDEIVIYGIQPLSIDYHEGLSDPVISTVTEVCKAIQSELELTQTKEDPARHSIFSQIELTESFV